MLRFSISLVAALALIGAATVAASAYTGAAYDKCMAKCPKSGVSTQCPHWCERKN